VTVVIPTYNERDNVQILLPKLIALRPDLDIIVVDDNSPDGTGAVVEELALAHPGRIGVIHGERKQGIGRAYLAGFHLALNGSSPLIAQMDADLSHSPDDLSRLLARAESVDLVLGSRYVPGGATSGWPWYRRFISRFGGLYARLVLGVPIADLTGGFKVYRRETLERIGLDAVRSDGYVFQIETTYRALRDGLAVVEVPITFHERVAGQSKLSRRIVVEAMIVVWRLRFDRTLRSR
jgi:dolichol-phosphate mannosyltransferase